MLSLLKVINIALIDEIEVEFGSGLNLLTGETGSGKSIIVDSLGALIGDRVSSDLIKQGSETARIEGIFEIEKDDAVARLFEESGIELDSGELIIRRELSHSGKNRIFVNGNLVTQGFLKRLGQFLADIHGQGEQATLYDTTTHISMLDDFADARDEREAVAVAYNTWVAIRDELTALERDQAEKLQLIDILRFQLDEISRAGLQPGEEEDLENEKRRLNNIEKLSTLSSEAYEILYGDQGSALAALDRAERLIAELGEFDKRFRGFDEAIASAKALADELGSTARDFCSSLEYSPERLNQIEERLAEISRLKRKYGGTVEAVLEYLARTEQRLAGIENSELCQAELQKKLVVAEAEYRKVADALSKKRVMAAEHFESTVIADLRAVALDKAKFEVRIDTNGERSRNGSDKAEFYFSANPGEPPRPLARVASGGEASRLMLILKTASRANEKGKTAVFDEIDIGIGGRVAEAVGRKLKSLAASQQVFCVTHQPQIASLADSHFLVEKNEVKGRTSVTVRGLGPDDKIDEIARMLAGERITDAARENARSMLAGK